MMSENRCQRLEGTGDSFHESIIAASRAHWRAHETARGAGG
jgi:hypothetical protein